MSRQQDPGHGKPSRDERKALRKDAWEPRNAARRAAWKAQVLEDLAEQVEEVRRGR